MGQAKRRSPDIMPSDERARGASAGLAEPMIVCGSRGTQRSKVAKHELHSTYLVRGGDLAAVANRHAIIFVHGYNVTVSQGLASSADFYSKIQTSLARDEKALTDYAYLAFLWPGDVGPLWFSDAQEFAQESGAALWQLARDLIVTHGAGRVSLITHSLGAHVGLRSAAILGERLYSGKSTARYANVLLLAPAVENDVFERPNILEEYHFPDAPFGVDTLQIFSSRADDVLKTAFFASEFDKALGYSGPETMKPLKSMSDRVAVVLGNNYRFRFQLHDMSPRSTTVINPDLHAHHHSDYWTRPAQTDYYVNYIV